MRRGHVAPQAHGDLLFTAGRGGHRGHSDHVHPPDRLSAALPVLRYGLRFPWRAIGGSCRDPRARARARRAARLRDGRRAARAEELLGAPERAVRAGYRVSLETSGAMALADVDQRVVLVVDVKTPGSGEESRNRYAELAASDAARISSSSSSAAARITSGASPRCASSSSIRAAACFSLRATKSSRRASLPIGCLRIACRCAFRSSCTSICGASVAASSAASMPAHHTPGSGLNKAAVILLSGGLDSATTLALARAEGFDCYALSVAYGQRHSSELDAAARVARTSARWSIASMRVDLAGIGGSALTDSNMRVPEAPTTGIPLDLRSGAQHADAGACARLGGGARFAGHFHWRQRRGFFRLSRLPARVHRCVRTDGRACDPRRGRRAGPAACTRHSSGGRRRRSFARACVSGWILASTVSCYQADELGRACGRCDSCRIRRSGFEAAGVAGSRPATEPCSIIRRPVEAQACKARRTVNRAGR